MTVNRENDDFDPGLDNGYLRNSASHQLASCSCSQSKIAIRCNEIQINEHTRL